MNRVRLALLVIASLLTACAGTEVPAASPSKLTIEDVPAQLRSASSVEAGEGCGPELSTLDYKVQCSDGSFAMLCLNADPTHKRCACQRGGRYFWTAGYYCHGRLLCEAQRCR